MAREARDWQQARAWLSIEGLAEDEGIAPELGSAESSLSPEEAELPIPGAPLAVTFEDETTAPHDAPTPPIVLAGTLDRV